LIEFVLSEFGFRLLEKFRQPQSIQDTIESFINESGFSEHEQQKITELALEQLKQGLLIGILIVLN